MIKYLYLKSLTPEGIKTELDAVHSTSPSVYVTVFCIYTPKNNGKMSHDHDFCVSSF